MATSQIVLIVCAILAVGFIIKLIKGFIKFVLLIVIIVGGVFAYNQLSPTQVAQLKNFAQVSTQTVQQVSNIAKDSDSIKVDTANGNKISVKVGNEWINLSDIAQVKSLDANEAVIVVKGKEIKITDENVKQVLELVQSQQKQGSSK